MRQINLLPQELKPSKQIGIAVKKTIKYLVVIVIAYLLILSASFGTTYYFDNELNKLKQSKASLSSQIKSLSNVETSTINIRDKVAKYESIKGRSIENEGMRLSGEFYKNLPVDSEIKGIEIMDDSVSFSATTPDTASLIYILDQLVHSGLYKEVSVSEINYSAESGYKFGVIAYY